MTGLNGAQYSLEWEKVSRAPYWLKTDMEAPYWSVECLISMKSCRFEKLDPQTCNYQLSKMLDATTSVYYISSYDEAWIKLVFPSFSAWSCFSFFSASLHDSASKVGGQGGLLA